MKHLNPRHHRVDREYDAVERITHDDATMRGDNTAAWEERCRPLYVLLSSGAKTLTEIKAFARSQKLPTQVTEDALYWLEARGRVERGDDRKWRLVNV